MPHIPLLLIMNLSELLRIFEDPSIDVQERIDATQQIEWHLGLAALPFFLNKFKEHPLLLRKKIAAILEEKIYESFEKTKRDFQESEFLLGKGNLNVFREYLTSPEAVIRAASYLALLFCPSNTKDKKSLLMSMSEDSYYKIRLLAAKSFEAFNKLNLVEKMLSDKNSRVVAESLVILGKYNWKISQNALERLKNYPDSTISKAYAEYILDLGERGSFLRENEVYNLLFSKKPNVQARAIDVLVNKGDKRVFEFFETFLKPNVDQKPVLTTIKAIKNLEIKKFTSNLQNLLKDPRKIVRKRALEAMLLLQKSGEQDYSWLIPLIKDPVFEIRSIVYKFIKKEELYESTLFLLSALHTAQSERDFNAITSIIKSFPKTQKLIPMVQIYRNRKRELIHPFIMAYIIKEFTNPLALKHLRHISIPYLIKCLKKPEFTAVASKLLEAWGHRALNALEQKVLIVQDKSLKENLLKILERLYEKYKVKTKGEFSLML